VLVVLRIVAYVAVILIGASLAAFLVTRDRRFLRFAWQIVKYGLVFAGVVLALLAVERLAVL
jgi:nucleoside recognition membrane protein YjiH